MHKNESFFVRDFVGIGFGIADGVAFENDACIGSLGLGDLRKGVPFGITMVAAIPKRCAW